MATSLRRIPAAALLLCALLAWPLCAEEAREKVKPIRIAVDVKWTPVACDIDTVLKASRKRYDALKGYFGRMARRHRFGGELIDPQISNLWYRKPLSIRMTVTGGPRPGTDILYVQGRNKGRLRARGVGIFRIKAMNLKPDSGLAMKGELHPFTSVGIETTLNLVEGQYALLKKHVADLEIASWKAVKDGRELRRYDFVMPADEKDADGNDVYFCDRAEVVFDLKLNLPTEARVYEDGRLREEYVYCDLEIDPTFGASVFDFDDI